MIMSSAIKYTHRQCQQIFQRFSAEIFHCLIGDQLVTVYIYNVQMLTVYIYNVQMMFEMYKGTSFLHQAELDGSHLFHQLL